MYRHNKKQQYTEQIEKKYWYREKANIGISFSGKSSGNRIFLGTCNCGISTKALFHTKTVTSLQIRVKLNIVSIVSCYPYFSSVS